MKKISCFTICVSLLCVVCLQAAEKPTVIELETLIALDYFEAPVAFSPDGSKIVTWATPEIIRIWDTNTGEVLSEVRELPKWRLDRWWHDRSAPHIFPGPIGFFPDGKKVFVRNSHGPAMSLRIWNPDSEDEWQILEDLLPLDSTPTSSPIPDFSVVFSPDGKKNGYYK